MAATDKRDVLATLGGGAVLALCCAAPALIVAGAFGAWLRNPWVIGAALAAVLVVAWRVWTRHRRGHTSSQRPNSPVPTIN